MTHSGLYCTRDPIERVGRLGFEGENPIQRIYMLGTLNSRTRGYIYLSTDDLRRAADRALEMLSEAYVKPQQYRHRLMRPLDFQVLAAGVHKPNRVKR